MNRCVVIGGRAVERPLGGAGWGGRRCAGVTLAGFGVLCGAAERFVAGYLGLLGGSVMLRWCLSPIRWPGG